MEALDIVVLLLIAYQGALDTCCPSRPADCVDLVCCALESWLEQRQRRLRPSGPIAPIQTLPVEILQMVFEHAAAELADTHDAVNMELIPTLMATCTKFRAVALDTPFLWSFVTFKWTKPRHLSNGFIGRMGLFNRAEILLRLERSKQTTFHLLVLMREEDVKDLWMETIQNPTEHPVNGSMDELKELVRPYMHRCRKVEVVEIELATAIFQLHFPSFFPLTEEMPELHTIIHDAGRMGSGPLFRSDISAPALQNIVCINAPLFKPSLLSTRTFFMPVDWLLNLTTLEIQSIEASRLETFKECARLPKLQHLRLTHYHKEYDRVDDGETKLVHFPELRVLSMRGAPTTLYLERILAPHLEILEVEAGRNIPNFFVGSQFPALRTFTTGWALISPPRRSDSSSDTQLWQP